MDFCKLHSRKENELTIDSERLDEGSNHNCYGVVYTHSYFFRNEQLSKQRVKRNDIRDDSHLLYVMYYMLVYTYNTYANTKYNCAFNL